MPAAKAHEKEYVMKSELFDNDHIMHIDVHDRRLEAALAEMANSPGWNTCA